MDDIFEAMRAFNNGEEGYFCNRELLKKSRENVARKEGIKKTRIEIIKNMLALNMSKETISQVTKLSITEIDKLLN